MIRWIEINESTILKDNSTGSMINYSESPNLSTVAGFQEIIWPVPQIRNAVDDFQLRLINGILVNSPYTQFREYKFEENSGRYIFKLGIIPQRTGIYRIALENATNVLSNNYSCSKASFTINFKNTNQHFYMYPGGAGTPPGGGTYYFKVK